MATHGSTKNALDEFVSESVLTREVPRSRGSEKRGEVDVYVVPGDVQLDPIEIVARAAAPAANSSSVQMWPMLAAALIAIGVSMLVMAAFARFGFSTL